MNAAAWTQLSNDWNAIRADLTAHSGPTASHAWRACCRLRWAPLWSEHPIPVATAVRFKTGLGLERVLSSWLLLNPGAASRPLTELVALDALMQRLDTEGWLHGHDEVCPAPQRWIEEAWTALRSPTPPKPHVADITCQWVSGLWAVLGATRGLLRQGVLHEVPGWSPVATPRTDWPAVTRLLAARGPGLLVREVPRFEPRWALHVWDEAPVELVEHIERCEAARSLRELDACWEQFVA